ncbi:hypothetical protein GGX14DRAFT_575738 [Mycena pura]|uniref:Uncharacterized protein n=1 Tax=Mycena pura TaxID=153505 RepID=A0AAD6Y1W6_9AGAR|nr:hypothetical protein GGX14DRAFT_575738 [Mycena pura]
MRTLTATHAISITRRTRPSAAPKTDTPPASCNLNRGPQCCHCGWRGEHSSTCPFTACADHTGPAVQLQLSERFKLHPSSDDLSG